jgi:competence protein ComEA
MLKKILAILALLYAAVSFAAVDVNKATAAELDGVKGIGPAISKNIVDERKKGGDFKNWDDFVARVKGIGDTKAANLSKEGLTVNGAEFKKAAAAKDAKADAKAAATDAKAEKKEAKADVKAEAKKDAKAEKAEKKEAKKKEKEAKAKAEDAKKDAKAAAAKPAASAASAKK